MNINSLSFIPSVNSTDQQWIVYHKALKKDVGTTNANALWLKTWEKRKNENAITGSKANTSDLRDYMKSQKVNLSADGAFSSAVNIWDSATDSLEAMFGISKWIVIVLAAIIIIPAFMILINIAKDPVGAAKAAAPLAV